MAEFERQKGLKALIRSIVLNKAMDLLQPGEWLTLQNVRQYRAGEIRTRPAIVALNATPLTDTSLHSVRLLNDPISGATIVLVGAGTNLYWGSGVTPSTFTLLDTSYDGNPLTFLPFRPNQNASPFMYVANGGQMRRIRLQAGPTVTAQNWGIAPPTAPPTVALQQGQTTTIDTGLVTTGWTGDGTIFTNGNINANSLVPTIGAILYDTGSTGWCSIQATGGAALTFYNEVLPGAYVILNNTGGNQETVLIDSIYQPIKTTTIASIAYDSGSTGKCTMVLSASHHRNLVKYAMIQLGGNTEVVTIADVSTGPDGSLSIRTSTANTHTAGDSATGLTSFRVFAVSTHVATENITFQDITAISTSSLVGTGFIKKAIAIDLSTNGGRPTQDDDYIEWFMAIDQPSNIVEIQLLFDISSIANTFTDYYYKVLRPDDFIGANTTTLNLRQRKIQRDQVDTTQISPGSLDLTAANYSRRKNNHLAIAAALGPRGIQYQSKVADQIVPWNGPGSDTTTGGTGAANSVKIYIKDFSRVGQDLTRGWKDVNTVKIQVRLTNTTTITTQGITLVGSFGPDVATTEPGFQYAYVWLNSATGARSNPSPATRTGIISTRQRVFVTIPSAPDSQVDKVELFRFGGSSSQWKYVGTAPVNTIFNDDYPDDVIAANEPMRFDRFQPFPVLDVPKSGTANVVGTRVTATAGTFSTSWSAGSEIIINNTTYHLYAPPSSTTVLDTVENIGSLTAVSWLVPEATINGSPLASVAGPYGLGEFGSVMVGLGTGKQAGTVFWTNPDDPDSASDKNNLDLTSPSEPLQFTAMYDGRVVIFSTKRAFLMRPTTDVNGQLTFLADEIPNGKGAWTRFCHTITPDGIVWAAADGLYLTRGDVPEPLHNDLYPLFPHDGQAGQSVAETTLNPIDFTQTNDLRLAYVDGRIYFTFKDASANKRSLVLNPLLGGWESLDIYSTPINLHYAEEGQGNHQALLLGTDGKVYRFSGSAETITCEVKSGAVDQGDPSLFKLYGDLRVDYDSAGATLTPVVTTDAVDSSLTATPALTPTTLSHNGRMLDVVDIAAGVGKRAKNILFDLSWSSTLTIKFYGWEPTVIQKEILTVLRATDLSDLGYPGPKFVQGVRFRADTLNQARTVDVYADNGVNGQVIKQIGQSLTVQHNGESRIAYSFPMPFICHMAKLLPTDANSWLLFPDIEWIYNPAPDLAINWITQPTTFNFSDYGHVRDSEIAHISTADITYKIIVDEVTYTYTIANGGGSYRKTYSVPQSVKGKAHEFSLTSTAPFRLFVKDTVVRAKPWRGGSYGDYHPFGDLSRQEGAEARI